MTYLIICYFKIERSWTIEIPFPFNSHPKGYESLDPEGWKHKGLKHFASLILVWHPCWILFKAWRGLLNNLVLCGRNTESLPKLNIIFLFILIYFICTMMNLDYFQPGSCWAEISYSYLNIGSLATELSLEAVFFWAGHMESL